MVIPFRLAAYSGEANYDHWSAEDRRDRQDDKVQREYLDELSQQWEDDGGAVPEVKRPEDDSDDAQPKQSGTSSGHSSAQRHDYSEGEFGRVVPPKLYHHTDMDNARAIDANGLLPDVGRGEGFYGAFATEGLNQWPHDPRTTVYEIDTAGNQWMPDWDQSEHPWWKTYQRVHPAYLRKVVHQGQPVDATQSQPAPSNLASSLPLPIAQAQPYPQARTHEGAVPSHEGATPLTELMSHLGLDQWHDTDDSFGSGPGLSVGAVTSSETPQHSGMDMWHEAGDAMTQSRPSFKALLSSGSIRESAKSEPDPANVFSTIQDSPDANRGPTMEHVAGPPDLYHIAPVTERNRILQHGLQPAKPSLSDTFGENQPSLTNSPTSVYGFDSEDTAKYQMQALEGNENFIEKPGTNDLWRIPREQIQQASMDPELYGAWAVHHPVRPVLHFRPEDRWIGPQEGQRLMEEYQPSGLRKDMQALNENHMQNNPWGVGFPNRVIGSRVGSTNWWKPGQFGRGLISPQKDVHLWPEEEMTHAERLNAMGVPHADQQNWERITIMPNGSVGIFHPDEAELLKSIHPRLRPAISPYIYDKITQKAKPNPFYVKTSEWESKFSEYMMNHRPGRPDDAEEATAAPMHDLTKVFPDDIYTHPHYYFHDREHDPESYQAALRARGNPDAPVQIYRASPVGELNTGDWITPNRAYAENHAMHPHDPAQDMPVWSYTVPAHTLWQNGDSLSEYGYHGPAMKTSKTADFNGHPPLFDPQEEYYHFAPTTERARIQTHGLKAADPTVRTPFLKANGAHGANGVYMAATPEDAHFLEGLSDAFDVPYDVWKVKPQGNIYPDRDMGSLGNYVYTDGDIHPQHIQMHSPWEHNKDNPEGWDERQFGEVSDRGDALENSWHEMRGIQPEWGIGRPNHVMGKTADYYHMAPTAERARIKQHGLIPGKPLWSENWTEDEIPTRTLKKQPEGVYVTQQPNDFHMHGDNDVWRIPENQVQDIEKDRATKGWVIKHPVQPELHSPFEYSDKAEGDMSYHLLNQGELPPDGDWQFANGWWGEKTPNFKQLGIGRGTKRGLDPV